MAGLLGVRENNGGNGGKGSIEKKTNKHKPDSFDSKVSLLCNANILEISENLSGNEGKSSLGFNSLIIQCY